MPEESEVIYWVIDEGGNVLLDPSPPAGDYNVGIGSRSKAKRAASGSRQSSTQSRHRFETVIERTSATWVWLTSGTPFSLACLENW
jgi:hypothetical protein